MKNQHETPEALAHALFTAAQLAPGEGIEDAVGRLAALVEAQQPAPSAAAAPEGGPPGSGGWEKHAIEMERQRDYYRQRCHTMEEHQNGGVWYWQGDDGDSLESMGNSMLVVIRADQLRSLMQPSPTPQADSQPGDKDLVAVPRDLIGAACSAIDKKRDGARTLAELRRYTVGSLSAAITSAPQADSQPAPMLDSLALMKVVMRADEALAGRCTRGTTNWAAAIGKAVQDAVLAARAPADSVTAPAGGATGKNLLQVQAWVIPDGNGGGQFSWQKQSERYWIRLTPPAQAADSVLEDAARLLRQILAASQDGDSDTHLSAHFVSRIETITKAGGAA